ncbi:hypothetical protein T10_2970 [Trichinella papuae]|uniref:Uncharacterized protein n=1 Tax=Trichinella papuae TaxID=268474 RepID=A0A0V1MVQ1_9BILA|nr:hypothetical protein T10_2970 [Trichinella papuae]
MRQLSATEAWRKVAVRLFPTGKLPFRVVALIGLLLDDVSLSRLRPAPWDSAIASACSRMNRWKAVRSDRNLSSAITRLSHSIRLAAVILSL